MRLLFLTLLLLPELASARVGQSVSSGIANGSFYGSDTVAAGTNLYVGAYGDNQFGTQSGAVYAYKWNGTDWGSAQKLTADDPGGSDQFGFYLGADQNRVIIGATGWDDPAKTNCGGAYIFQRKTGIWTQEALLKPDSIDLPAAGVFGRSVGLSGQWAIVGQPGFDRTPAGTSSTNTGNAYIFQHNGVSWQQYQKLQAADLNASENFGFAAKIDGEWAAIGAYRDQDKGNNTGSVFVYRLVAGTWTLFQKLYSTDILAEDSFGQNLSINGNYLLIGAEGRTRYRNSDEYTNAGVAYVFEFDGSEWIERQRLEQGPNEFGSKDGSNLVGDRFGAALDIFGDYVVIGARLKILSPGTRQNGAAYVFKRSGSQWFEEERLTLPQLSPSQRNENFAWSVTLSEVSGPVIGAPFYETTAGVNDNAGEAFAFLGDPPTPTPTITPSPTVTPTPTETPSPTATATPLPTQTPTSTPPPTPAPVPANGPVGVGVLLSMLTVMMMAARQSNEQLD